MKVILGNACPMVQHRKRFEGTPVLDPFLIGFGDRGSVLLQSLPHLGQDEVTMVPSQTMPHFWRLC